MLTWCRGLGGAVRQYPLQALALGLLIVGQVHYANLTFDDAFISFRYADNLIRGEGLVFNPGERVEGYTNFLYTLILAVPTALRAGRFEHGMLVSAKVLGALLALGTQLLLPRTARLVVAGEARAAIGLAAVFLASSAAVAVWSVGALEGPLVGMLLLAAVHLALREYNRRATPRSEPPLSALCLALATLTRPEPLLLFPWFIGLRLARRVGAQARKRPWASELGYALMFLVPWLLHLFFRRLYYGEWLPNTYYAKVYADPQVLNRGLHYLERASEHLLLGPLGLAIVVPLLLARQLTIPVLWLMGLVATSVTVVVVEGGDWMPAFRLLAPLLPLVGLLVVAAFSAASELELEHLKMPKVPPWVMPGHWSQAWDGVIGRLAKAARAWRLQASLRLGCQLALGLSVALSAWRGHQSVRVAGLVSGWSRIDFEGFHYFDMARFMNAHIRGRPLLAIGEAGVIPYYTRLPALDLFGLLDKRISRLPGVMHHKFDLTYFHERKPEYVLLVVRRDSNGELTSDYHHARQLLGDAKFLRSYRPFHAFPTAVLYRMTRDASGPETSPNSRAGDSSRVNETGRPLANPR